MFPFVRPEAEKTYRIIRFSFFLCFSSLLPRVAMLLLLALSVSLSTLQALHHLTISRMFVFLHGRMGKEADG